MDMIWMDQVFNSIPTCFDFIASRLLLWSDYIPQKYISYIPHAAYEKH